MKRWDAKQAEEELRGLLDLRGVHQKATGHRAVALKSPPTVTCPECSFLVRLTVIYNPLERVRKYLPQYRKDLEAWAASPRTDVHVGGRDSFVETKDGRYLPTREVVGPDGCSSVPIERGVITGWPPVFRADGSFLGWLRFLDGHASVYTQDGVSLFSVEDDSGDWHFPA